MLLLSANSRASPAAAARALFVGGQTARPAHDICAQACRHGTWPGPSFSCRTLAELSAINLQSPKLTTCPGCLLPPWCPPAAYVRVRPAFAGEGRYFVRVPEGANKERFAFDDGNNLRDGLSVGE